MRVFAVSGFSGTGKTTLVESIVRELVAEGYSVVTVKSSQHEQHDEKGTDTERHRIAGAKESYYRGPSDRNLLIRDLVKSTAADFLIVEGMKVSPIPKFWCLGDSPIGDTIPIEVKAIISRKIERIEDKYGIPIIDASDIEGLVKIIKNQAVELDCIDV